MRETERERERGGGGGRERDRERESERERPHDILLVNIGHTAIVYKYLSLQTWRKRVKRS